jgi:uncharacterized protein
MKLLILGATGRVGSRIVADAFRDGHEVVALVRAGGYRRMVDCYPR